MMIFGPWSYLWNAGLFVLFAPTFMLRSSYYVSIIFSKESSVVHCVLSLDLPGWPTEACFISEQGKLHITCTHVYRPLTKLREGSVFTPVCHSVHRGVSVHGGFCLGGSLFRGSLSGGSLSRGFSVRETPRTVSWCFFSTWGRVWVHRLNSKGRVWVHHLSLSSGHHRNDILQWPSSLIPWLK